MIREFDSGTKVKVRTRDDEFECVVLESPSPDVVLVKLGSGYNVGLKEQDILSVRKVAEKKSSESRVKKIEKNKDLPNIALVVTGGTISSRVDYKTGGVKWLSDADELLRSYPDLLGVANVAKIEMPFLKASENMNPDDWSKIVEIVGKLVNDKSIDGVVVTHGTDFLHYTSAALSFGLENLGKPVVLTYSQRSSDRASSDANLNLVCAAQMAVSDVAGVVLVGHENLDDDFCYALNGAKVRKMHSSRRDTFRPINSKPVARVYRDKVEILEKYVPRDNSKKVKVRSKFSNKIALVKFYPGQNPDILEYYLGKGYKGLVVEGSGLGHLITDGKYNWLPKLKKIINAGVFVGVAPQTIYGRLHGFVYSAGRELKKAGLVYLEDMLPETAFVKLSWILADAKMKKNPEKFMLENFAGEFNDALDEKEFLN